LSISMKWCASCTSSTPCLIGLSFILLTRTIRTEEDLVDRSLAPARNGWRESSCCSRGTARTRNQCGPSRRSPRRDWRKWSARRDRVMAANTSSSSATLISSTPRDRTASAPDRPTDVPDRRQSRIVRRSHARHRYRESSMVHFLQSISSATECRYTGRSLWRPSKLF
jgi:hypothetical protein